MPAARNARAKCTMFSARRPVSWAMTQAFNPSHRSAGAGVSSAGPPSSALARKGGLALLLRRPDFCPHLVDQFFRLGAFEARDIVLILEQHPERVGDGRRIERNNVKLGQRRGPVERLGDAWRLEQVFLAQGLHEMHDLLR